MSETPRERVERLICAESVVIYVALCEEIRMLDDDEGHAGAAVRNFRASNKKFPLPDEEIARLAAMDDAAIRAFWKAKYEPVLLRAFADVRPS